MKNKKIYIIIGLIVIVLGVIVALWGFGVFDNNKEPNNVENTNAIKFKEEYEALNGQENASGKAYREVSIPSDNPFVYATPQEVIEMMDNKETFAVYFGFKSCPWCRSVIENLIKVAKDLNIKKIYYIDVLNIRDTYELNSKNKAEKTSDGTEGYYQLLEAFADVLSDYTLTTSKGKVVKVGEKRIYAPNIVSVVEGYMELTEEMNNESYEAIKCTLDCLKEKDACSLAC